MTRDELETRASEIYGEQWQSVLARRVRVDARTVRRWKSEKKDSRAIPDWLDAFLDLLERYPDER